MAELDLGGYSKIAVISDLHANAEALTAVLADMRFMQVDAVIMLGDILGYGPDVNTCLDIVSSLQKESQLHVIRGNHDQIFIELESGRSPYLEGLPIWLKEISEWTFDKLDTSLSEVFDWKHSLEIGNIYFSHANPFKELSNGMPDWSYLNDDSQILKAGKVLEKAGALVGVFGHNHRELLAAISASVERNRKAVAWAGDARLFVLNPGSVGQPRSSEQRATYLLIDSDSARLRYVAYDIESHLRRIWNMDISYKTRLKLASFFDRG